MIEQQVFREKFSKAVQDINGDPSLTAQEKKQAIRNLLKIPKLDMFQFLNQRYRTGHDISAYVAQYVSKHRLERMRKRGMKVPRKRKVIKRKPARKVKRKPKKRKARRSPTIQNRKRQRKKKKKRRN